MSSNATDLKAEFQRRGPWVSKFVIGEETYGGEYEFGTDPRLQQFFESFPRVQTILELGCLEGGHTMVLAQHPGVQRVVAIEGREASLARALFVQNVLGVSKASFVLANLERFNLSRLGRFDAVFCVGLLYHLPQPWKLVEQIARVSTGVFIWTHYAADDQANITAKRFKGMRYREMGLQDPLSGLSKQSFWPTVDSLLAMLQKYGFRSVRVIMNEPSHPHGAAITLAATLH